MRDLVVVRTELDAKREQMIKAGMRLGLSHPVTVKLSQEVDELHIEHMASRTAKNKRATCQCPNAAFGEFSRFQTKVKAE